MFRLLSGNKLKDKIRVEKISREFNLMSMNQMASYHVFLENYNIINFGASQKIKEKLLPSNPNSSQSIGNPAGIGKGTGFGLRDRDGIGLGHYRLRASRTKTCGKRYHKNCY